MALWLPVALDSNLVTGTYRFTFSNVFDINSIPALSVPSSYKIAGKLITVTRSYADKATKKYILEFQLKENPEPVTMITLGILVILGLSAGYMVLDKVEKLVDNPSVSFAVAVVAIILLFSVYKSFKKGVT